MVAHVLDVISKEMNQTTFDTGVAIYTYTNSSRMHSSRYFHYFFSAVNGFVFVKVEKI